MDDPKDPKETKQLTGEKSDAGLVEPTDALVAVTHACICGSDLWPYKNEEHSDTGRRMGHEAIGVVEDFGADVGTMKRGDLVVMPFAFSDGTCVFCRERLHTSCTNVPIRATDRSRFSRTSFSTCIPQKSIATQCAISTPGAWAESRSTFSSC